MNGFTYIAYFLFGIINGVIFIIMLFQMDKTYQKVISTSGNGIGIFAVYELLNLLLNPESKFLSSLLAIQLIGFFTASSGSLFLMMQSLRGQEGKSRLTILDIIVGYQDLLQDHYDLRKKEIDTELNYNSLITLKEDLDSREKLLAERENLYIASQRAINEQIKKRIHLQLPVNACVPLDQEAINLFPSMVQSLIYFVNTINQFTSDFERKSEEKENKESQYRFLVAYLLGICEYINRCLFPSTCNDVGIHFTVCVGGEYQQLVTSFGEFKEMNNVAVSMPSDRDIICECIQCRRSLIKSLNRKLRQNGKNDRIWLDYITFCINDIVVDEKPLLAMGIQVKDPDRYKRLMYFLNYCKFEDIIQENIVNFNRKVNIINALRPFFEQKELEAR